MARRRYTPEEAVASFERRRRLSGNQRLSSGEISDIFRPAFESELAFATEEERFQDQLAESTRRFNEDLTFRRNAADADRQDRLRAEEEQKRQAKIAAIGNTLQTGANLYLANKAVNLLRPTTSTGLFSPGTTASSGAPSVLAPASTSAEVSRDLFAGTEVGRAGGVTAEGAGLATIGQTFAGLPAPVQLGAAVGAGYAAKEISQRAGDIATDVTGSRTAGEVVEFFANPVGQTINVVEDLIFGGGGGGSIICTELARQGYLDRRTLALDGAYRIAYIDDQTYAGYLRFAQPIVRLMRRSKLVTHIVRPFAVAWAREMASRMEPGRQGALLGRMLTRLAPVCRWLGGIGHKEVRHA